MTDIKTNFMECIYINYNISHITPNAKLHKEVNNRLAKANSAFSRLYKCMWYKKHLNGLKISVIRFIVPATLQYRTT